MSDEPSTGTEADTGVPDAEENGPVAGTDATDDTPPPEDARPPRRAWLFAIVAPLLLVADLVTKIVAVETLDGEPPVPVLGGLVHLQIVRNAGAAFGMATGMTWLLTLVATGVVIAIIWIMPKLRSVGWAVGLAMVLAGALGNLVDRFFREPGPMRGHVVDFVSVIEPNGEFFPVFNVADSSIVCGGALIVLMALLGRDYDGTSTKDKPQDEPKDEPKDEPGDTAKDGT